MKLSAASLRAAAQRLFSPALLAYGIAGAVAAASFLSTLVLARLSGAAVIGEYALAISTANMLASFALLGLDRILVREVAGDLRVGMLARASGVVRAITIMVAAVSGVTAILYAGGLALTPLLPWLGGSPVAMMLVALAILVIPMQRLGYSILRAKGAPLAGQFFEALPTLLFAGAALLALGLGLVLTAPQAVGLTVLMQLVTALVAALLVVPVVRGWSAPRDPVDRRLLFAGVPLMAILFLQLFSDWLLLARISSTMGVGDVGPFRVAVQVTTIIATLVTTTESYVAARYAGDFRAGRPDLAWRRHRRATLLMAAMSAPLLLLLLLAPGDLLAHAFGPEFAGAATALSIMAMGQMFAIARGPLGSMLTMSGNDRVQLGLTVVGVALAALLALLLVPRFGLTGAGLAQAAPIMFRSVAGYLLARRLIPDRPAERSAERPAEEPPA